MVNNSFQNFVSYFLAGLFVQHLIYTILSIVDDDVIKWKFSVLLAICAGNSPATSEFPAQRPVTQSFDVFFDLRLDKQLSKQSWG